MMNQQELQHTNNNHQNIQDESIDLKKIIFKFLYNWYWFVLAVLFTGSLAYLYNRYTTPVYEMRTTVLVEEEKVSSPFSGAGVGASGSIFQGLGVMNSMRNIFNQLVILKSTPIVTRTLQELDFEVSYYAVGRVAVSERYKDVPFQVIWQENHPQIIESDFDLTILPNGKLELSMEEENVAVYSYPERKMVQRLPEFSFSRVIDPGTKITSDYCAFTILLNEHFNPKSPNNYKFRFHSRETLVKRYRARLDISLPEEETSILQLTLRDYTVQK
jgi:tyrosine-protein kinase Etk/Wzc